jgi:hypothetical protein
VKLRTEYGANSLGVAMFGVFFVGLGIYGFILALSRLNASQWWILGAVSVLVGALILYGHVRGTSCRKKRKRWRSARSAVQ